MPPGGWGLIMIAVGLFFVISATVRSRFFLYRLFVARSEMMMGEHSHRFLQFSGIMIIVAGLLMILDVF